MKIFQNFIHKIFIFLFTGNGYITTGVLREILRELDEKITNEELDMMISEIDSDGSGTVDFDGKSPYYHYHFNF